MTLGFQLQNSWDTVNETGKFERDMGLGGENIIEFNFGFAQLELSIKQPMEMSHNSEHISLEVRTEKQEIGKLQICKQDTACLLHISILNAVGSLVNTRQYFMLFTLRLKIKTCF